MAEKRPHNPALKRNMEVIRRFEKSLLSGGLTQGRMAKYLANLRTLSEHMSRDFEEDTK